MRQIEFHHQQSCRTLTCGIWKWVMGAQMHSSSSHAFHIGGTFLFQEPFCSSHSTQVVSITRRVWRASLVQNKQKGAVPLKHVIKLPSNLLQVAVGGESSCGFKRWLDKFMEEYASSGYLARRPDLPQSVCVMEVAGVHTGNVTKPLPISHVGICCWPLPEIRWCSNGHFRLSKCSHPYILSQIHLKCLAITKMGLVLGWGYLKVWCGSSSSESMSQELMYSLEQHHINNKANVLLGLGFRSWACTLLGRHDLNGEWTSG